MRIACLLFGVTLLFLTCTAEIPHVISVDCEATPIVPTNGKAFEECLAIWMFGQDKFSGLYSRDGSNQALEGFLYTEEGRLIEKSHVSLTRHDDEEDPISLDAFVMIADPSANDLIQLECDLETGMSKEHIISWEDDEMFDNPPMPPNARDYERQFLSPEEIQDRQRDRLPAQGFRMRLQILYDRAFAGRYGNDQTRIRRAIEKIYVHANSYFKAPTLTTQIELDTSGRPYIPITNTFTATGDNLSAFSFGGTLNSVRDADSYALLTYDGNRGGTTGIAYVASTCGTRTARTSINELFRDEMKTAATLVHEIGHNLGMRHDFGGTSDGFTNTNVKRYTSDGLLCTGIGGFMDYFGKTTRWSPCSVEDFTDYYRRVRNWCLADLQPGTGSPTVKPNPTNPTTCKDTSFWCFSLFCSFDSHKEKCPKTCKICRP